MDKHQSKLPAIIEPIEVEQEDVDPDMEFVETNPNQDLYIHVYMEFIDELFNI